MTPERRLEIISRTRALLDHPSKWGQQTMVQHPIIDRLLMRPPRMCLVAAISAAVHGVEPIIAAGLLWDQEVSEVHDYLWGLAPNKQTSPYDDPGRRLMTWNDRVEYADVVALLDAAELHTWFELDAAPAEDEQHQGHNREHNEDGPKHDAAIPPNG